MFTLICNWQAKAEAAAKARRSAKAAAAINATDGFVYGAWLDDGHGYRSANPFGIDTTEKACVIPRCPASWDAREGCYPQGRLWVVLRVDTHSRCGRQYTSRFFFGSQHAAEAAAEVLLATDAKALNETAKLLGLAGE